MIKFNELLIRSTWRDWLKNQLCYVGNDMTELKNNVVLNKNKYIIIDYSKNDFYPFEYIGSDNLHHYSSLIYLTNAYDDEYSIFRKAQDEGKEVWCKFSEGWVSNKRFGKFYFESDVKNYSLTNPNEI